MNASLVIGGLVIVVALTFGIGELHDPVSVIKSAIVSDDRSFFALPDEKDWPGDTLSLRQFQAAVDHFADCDQRWRWALIGPNEWLLKGTQYRLVRSVGAEIPNIHYSDGYWGGTVISLNVNYPIVLAKAYVEKIVADNYAYGGASHKTKP